MMSFVTCPTCQHTLKIEEGQMGRRHTCPSCNSPFLAGASHGAGAPPAASPPINKTMLGEIEPPIRYNCPRCKKALEDPASEAGTKKPCPYCGQRVQVPVAKAVAPLNKTMLGQAEADAPSTSNVPTAKSLPEARLERCLECGRDVTNWTNILTCQDCGSIFCSSGCIREHRYHAHERRPRRREPSPEPESDSTGLVLGLVFGGLFLFIFIIIIVVFASARW